ncbi:hypothetical protein B0H14DRAFT_3134319, partial [Mycena olivaceomarginata]
MTLAAHYADDPLDSDEDMPLAGISGMEHGNSLFNEAISYGGGDFRCCWGTSHREMENLGYYDHTIFADMTPMMADMFDKTDDCTVSDAVRAMAAMGLDESDEENDDDSSPTGVFNEDWAPHGSKTMFMLDLLDNLPRLRLSDDQIKAIIWVMKECGTPNVPSFSALRKMQKKMTQDIGLKPRHHTSSLQNQFYMNHPNDLLRLDFSNPLVREHLHFYPEITTTVSESWQAEKYVKEIEDDDLSPMWANWDGASHRHFYIKELAQSKD